MNAPSNPQRFAAPWGTHLKVLTPLTTLLIASALAAVLIQPGQDRVRPWVAALLIGVLLGGPAFMVLGYEVSPGTLSILRPGWRTRIPLTEFRSAEPGGAPDAFRIRLFGNGGFWSITGLFWNRRLRCYRSFANNPRQAVILHFERRRIIVSPDQPAAFIDAVKRCSGTCSNR